MFTMRSLWNFPPHAVLLLLLCGQARCTTICDSLHCVNDYIENITCTWRIDASPMPDVSYHLTATMMGETISCSLTATSCSDGGKGFAECSCQLYQEYGISQDRYSMNMMTKIKEVENSSVDCPEFDTTKHIKPIAPFSLNVSHTPPCETYNFTWQMAYETNYIQKFEYELRYQRTQDNWELQKVKYKRNNQRFLQLVSSELVGGKEHVAQVRSRPALDTDYQGTWSEWSRPVKWRTELCETDLDPDAQILIGCGVMAVTFVFVTVMIINKRERLWRKLWVITPDPEPFFKPLFMEHGGNFTKWVNARYPDVLYDISEKNAMVLEKSDAVQVHDGRYTLDKASMLGLKPKEKQSDIHSSWQALRGPCSCTSSAHSGGQFGSNNQQWKDKSYGQATVDMVTVTDKSGCSHCKQNDDPARPPYMTQCNSNPVQRNPDGQDYPPSRQYLNQLHPLTPGIPELCGNASPLNGMMSLLQPSAGPDPMGGNVLDLQCLNIGDWDPENETFSSNSEDASWADRNGSEGGSWNDSRLDAISSSSRLEPDLAYPKILLDLDTVDSGFTETDPCFMTPGDLECHDALRADGVEYEKGPDGNSLTNSEEEQQYYRSYVKQWVKSPSTAVN
ncbi:interleukin-21 receptor-like [Rhinoraja longicauda]